MNKYVCVYKCSYYICAYACGGSMMYVCFYIYLVKLKNVNQPF